MAKKHSVSELKDALQLICTHRDCAIIEYWLKNGQYPPYSQGMELDIIDLPAGLYNIGNTCYVNPVFQFLFSLTELRAFLFTYKVPEKIDVSILNDYEKKLANRAFSFIKLIQELFFELLFSDEMVVTPQKKLIQLILNDIDGNLFGLQQDITETMDQIFLMFSLILKVQGIAITDSSPFYGKELQTIIYKTPSGEETKLQKEIGYRNIIVDMKPNLIDALDDYYGRHKVEYENSTATKYLSIAEPPSFLSFRINRLSFDREKQRPVKSNEFIKFPKTLRMDRFFTGREVEREERRHKLKMLRGQLIMKKEIMGNLSRKEHQKYTPLELLSQTANMMSENQVLANQLSILSHEIKILIEGFCFF
jgi:ubiquitin carboxyl-terminal hydrolase 25/28